MDEDNRMLRSIIINNFLQEICTTRHSLILRAIPIFRADHHWHRKVKIKRYPISYLRNNFIKIIILSIKMISEQMIIQIISIINLFKSRIYLSRVPVASLSQIDARATGMRCKTTRQISWRLKETTQALNLTLSQEHILVSLVPCSQADSKAAEAASISSMTCPIRSPTMTDNEIHKIYTCSSKSVTQIRISKACRHSLISKSDEIQSRIKHWALTASASTWAGI